MQVKETTNGVSIAVHVRYSPEFSNPLDSTYCYDYSVFIENYNGFPVEVQSKAIYTVDAATNAWERHSSGICGRKAVIGDKSLSYNSAVKFQAPIGRMWGVLECRNVYTGEEFTVLLPDVDFVCPNILN